MYAAVILIQILAVSVGGMLILS